MKSRFALTLLACAALQGAVAFAPGGAAQTGRGKKSDCGGCTKVKGEATGSATSPVTFQVAVAGDLAAVSTATLISPSPAEAFPKVQAGELIQATTSHVFEVTPIGAPDGACDAGEDCFTTLDRAVLSPTGTPGLYRLNSHLAIVGGEGAYQNACGKLVAHGFINFFAPNGPTVEWRYSGRVCECTP